MKPPDGTEHTLLFQESKKLWRFIKGGDGKTPQWKKEQMFVQMLEGLSQGEKQKWCVPQRIKNYIKSTKDFLRQLSKKRSVGTIIL